LFRGVFAGRKVLLTGHTGFKGSWLAAWLLDLGAEVCGYALAPSTAPNLFTVLGLEKRCLHKVADIRDEHSLRQTFGDFQPEFVFHLAAQPLVLESYRDPKGTYETNVLGTVNMLEAIRRTRTVRVVVNVTSDKCYENREWPHGYRESDPMGGYDPYSSSKGCAELVTAAYRRSFFAERGIALATARSGNVIGGGDWAPNRLLPDLVRALSKGETARIRSGESIRPWQFVLEPLSGYLWLAALLHEEPGRYSGGWNFGPSDTDILTVGDIVEQTIRLWGGGCCEPDESRPAHEAGLLRLDIGKARLELGWRPVYDSGRALAETVAWYRCHTDGGDAAALLARQLAAYEETAMSQSLAWADGGRRAIP
jgi:CDP-glucose 4,6-dehydratase